MRSSRGWEDEAHLERVATWSRRLAKELKLNGAERTLDVELGALLHEVGYINLRGIDFAKKGPLNSGEWFELRRHTEFVVALLLTIPALRLAIPLVANQHEHFDGTGYPRGLRGNEIPIDARIFHLVDTYEAMTSDRSYHARMSDQEARAEIERRVGTHSPSFTRRSTASIPRSGASSSPASDEEKALSRSRRSSQRP